MEVTTKATDDALATAARTASRRLVPFLLLLYVVSWIDRVNVGFAALQMNQDLGFTAAVYGLGAGLFFLGYSIFEIPSNLLLTRVGARRWIARIMVSWGLVSMALAFVHSAGSFYALRLLLGIAEAGFFPGIIYYLGTWFPATERARAMAGFTLAMPIASIVGGPLAGALLGLEGTCGLRGWQWLFLVEGLPAVLLGLVVLAYLPDGPRTARWLTTAEANALADRLDEEWSTVAPARASNWRAIAFSRHVWLLAVSFMLASIGSYGLQFWLPEILKGVPGRSNFTIGILAAVPYVPAALAMRAISVHSDHSGERVLHSALPCFAAALGFGLAAWTGSPIVSLGALTLAACGVYGRHGAFWTLPPRYLDGRVAAGGIALITSVGSVGGFVSPYVVGLIRTATGSYAGALCFLAAAMLLSGLLLLPMRAAVAPQSPSA